MNESVIFALRLENEILCEWREYNGVTQNCLLGGDVEGKDREIDDYILSAVKREAREELGISVERSEKIGEFVSNNNLFHVVLVDSWSGHPPRANLDNQYELHWVPLTTLIGGITLEPLKNIVTKLKFT